MKIRVEGVNPTTDGFTGKVHSDHDQYYIYDDLRYGPIHEEGKLSREEMIKEFLELYPQFEEDDCRIIRVGEERNIHGVSDKQ